jgi:hypothetical protein
MRQTAQRAHVGLGTRFNYAEEKRDLVLTPDPANQGAEPDS